MKERFPIPTPDEIINDIDEKEEKNISNAFLNSDKTRNDSNKITKNIINEMNNKNKHKNIFSFF